MFVHCSFVNVLGVLVVGSASPPPGSRPLFSVPAQVYDCRALSAEYIVHAYATFVVLGFTHYVDRACVFTWG